MDDFESILVHSEAAKEAEEKPLAVEELNQKSTEAEDDTEARLKTAVKAIENGDVLSVDFRDILLIKDPEIVASSNVAVESIASQLKDEKSQDFISGLSHEQQTRLGELFLFGSSFNGEPKGLDFIFNLKSQVEIVDRLDKLTDDEKSTLVKKIIDAADFKSGKDKIDALKSFSKYLNFEDLKTFIQGDFDSFKPGIGTDSLLEALAVTDEETKELILSAYPATEIAGKELTGRISNFDSLKAGMRVVQFRPDLLNTFLEKAIQYFDTKDGEVQVYDAVENIDQLTEVFKKFAEILEISNPTHREFIKKVPILKNESINIEDVRNKAESLHTEEEEGVLFNIRMMVHNAPGKGNIDVLESLIGYLENRKGPDEYNVLIKSALRGYPEELSLEVAERIRPQLEVLKDLKADLEKVYGEGIEAKKDFVVETLMKSESEETQAIAKLLSKESNDGEATISLLDKIAKLREKFWKNEYFGLSKSDVLLSDVELEQIGQEMFGELNNYFQSQEVEERNVSELLKAVLIGMKSCVKDGYNRIEITEPIKKIEDVLNRGDLTEEDLAELHLQIKEWQGGVELFYLSDHEKKLAGVYAEQGVEGAKEVEKADANKRKASVLHTTNEIIALANQLLPEASQKPKRKSVAELRRELGIEKGDI